MAKISSVNLSWKQNYVSFNDTDVMTDYFHGYLLNQKETAQWIKEDGADIIKVTVTNNDKGIPAERRLKNICKVAGYEYEDKSHMVKWFNNSNTEGLKIEYELRRIKIPSEFLKVKGVEIKAPQFKIKWFMPASQKWSETVAMDFLNKERFVSVLKDHNINNFEVLEA